MPPRTRKRLTYEKLGDFAKTELFRTRETELPYHVRNASELGFTVLARLLSLAPSAYKQYCRRQGIPRDLDHLGTALKDDTETLRKFMWLPIDSSRPAEYAFGLRHYRGGFRARRFGFEEGERGLPVLRANDRRFAKHSADPQYRDHLPTHWQRCLAARLVVETIWPGMVDLAAQAPEVFARDLGMT